MFCLRKDLYMYVVDAEMKFRFFCSLEKINNKMLNFEYENIFAESEIE